MSLKAPKLNPNAPDYQEQIQHHLDLLWQELDNLKGIGGKTIRLLGPLDLMGIPIQGAAPATPSKHSGSHQDGGTDEITVVGLSGLLADNQTPLLAAAGQRGGVKIGDVFTLAAEVLTLALRSGWGLQKVDSELCLLKQAAIASVASADATDLATALVLANEMKSQLNSVISYLKLAEILSDFTGYFAEFYFAEGYFATGYYPATT